MVDDARLTVLVVDDEEPVRSATCLSLRRAGCDVIEAATCRAAFAQVEALRPDVLLLDMHLHGELGLDLLPMLDQAGLVTPVVMLTGLATREQSRRAGELGVYKVLDKPATVTEIVDALGAAVEQHGRELSRVIRWLGTPACDGGAVHGAVVRASAAPGTDLIAFRQCARAIELCKGPTAPDVVRVRATLTEAGLIRRALPWPLLEVLVGLAAAATAAGGVRGFQMSPDDRRALHRLTGDDHVAWRRYARTQAGLRLVLTTTEHVGQIALVLGYPHENALARDLRKLLGLGPRALRARVVP
jgi:CheY-like chemotaxis protein